MPAKIFIQVDLPVIPLLMASDNQKASMPVRAIKGRFTD